MRRAIPIVSIVAALVFTAALPAGAEPLVEQSFQLRPGWNAIYLEVQPEPRSPEALFAGLPVASVWTWQPRSSSVEFIRDPDEGLLNQPGWLGWFPEGPHAFLSNLHAIQGHRAYLVNVQEGAAPFGWTVTGRPSLRPIRWSPDSFSLVGFPVDPDQPPSFGSFLEPSPAHAGQPVYRLVPDGYWERVMNPWSESIRSGEAYWVYTRGASDYTGPIEVGIDTGEGLDYGSLLVERKLRIRNRTGELRDLHVRTLPSSQSPPLCYWTLETRQDAESGESYRESAWLDLPADHSVQVEGDGETLLRVAVRRSRLDAEQADSVLEITDGAGLRHRIPVSVNNTRILDVPHSGLWVGNVVVDSISEVHVDPLTPTPVKTGFGFRVLVHVDAVGVATLLRQVWVMWEPGSPGQYVLISDDDLLPRFDPATLRDGEPVSYRISTAAYDFTGSGVPMTGTFGTTVPPPDPDPQNDPDPLLCSVDLLDAAPTNPFRHPFHPDHDLDVDPSDIDADPIDFTVQPYDILRGWTLRFAASDPTGVDPPEWGDEIVGGAFEETLSGVHRQPILVRGSFRLWRVSTDATLNPAGS